MMMMMMMMMIIIIIIIIIRYFLDFNVTIFKRNYFKFLGLYLFEAF